MAFDPLVPYASGLHQAVEGMPEMYETRPSSSVFLSCPQGLQDHCSHCLLPALLAPVSLCVVVWMLV